MNSVKLNILAVITLALLSVSCREAVKKSNYNEKYRPQFHFSPPGNWMNDPNGLVFYDGEYHLFYQYYPDSTVWGPMHWGHAVSRDLVHWDNLPIALYPDSLGYIFSGSAVIDWKNRTGFQTGKNSPMVAIFTQHSDTRLKQERNDFQNQSIAYSNNNGRTFEKFAGNPVIVNKGEKDFRDPKVSWVGSINKWVMVLAAGQKIEFFSSPDLLTWEYLSEFGTDAGAHGGVWECPDLFQLKAGDKDKWILIVNINPGGPNGGSGTQYFIGEFNGREFLNDNPKETILWLDDGPDNYAGVTWSDIPENDGRRILIGWMSNWSYAQVTPTVEWRSASTIPRTLELKNTLSGLRLYCSPVKELEKLRGKRQDIKIAPDSVISITGLNELEMKVKLAESTADDFGLIFSNGKGEQMVIGYSTKSNQFYADRSRSGLTGFSPEFPKVHYSPRISADTGLGIHLFLDHSSIELFADGGLNVMTEIFFPTENYDRVSFFRKNGKAKVTDCTIYDLNSIWSE